MDTSVKTLKASFRVSPNIALIKYWGKFDEELILPLNPSLSVTLSEEDLYTETSVEFTPDIKEDTLILNGEPSELTKRLKNVINYFRNRFPAELEIFERIYKKEELDAWHFRINSTNNFPTAAGLASSSSGIACLVCCLKEIFQFKEEFEGQLSEVARIGSGSASRSIYGGAVEWKGIDPQLYGQTDVSKEDKEKLSKECVALQVFPQEAFDDLRILILVARSEKKDVPSTSGMATSVQNSELLKHRVHKVVPERIADIKEAIKNKDWHSVFEITMRDSNNFHAICLDTYPPIFYMNQSSQNIIKAVTAINKQFEKNILAYTYDAGSNAVLLVRKQYYEDIASLFVQRSGIEIDKVDAKLVSEFPNISKSIINDIHIKDANAILADTLGQIQLERIISTKVGKGPIKI